MLSEDAQRKIAMCVIIALLLFSAFAFVMAALTREDKPVYQEPLPPKDSGGGTNPIIKYHYFKRAAGIK